MLNKNYTSIFELGTINNNPAVKVLRECEICPITLAALVTALFETVMKTVNESQQIEYEKAFTKALKTIMKERHNYEITFRTLSSEDES